MVVGDLNGDNALAVAAEVRTRRGGRALGVQFDISDDSSVGTLVAAAISEFGGLDAMHANAADLHPRPSGATPSVDPSRSRCSTARCT